MIIWTYLGTENEVDERIIIISFDDIITLLMYLY